MTVFVKTKKWLDYLWVDQHCCLRVAMELEHLHFFRVPKSFIQTAPPLKNNHFMDAYLNTTISSPTLHTFTSYHLLFHLYHSPSISTGSQVLHWVNSRVCVSPSNVNPCPSTEDQCSICSIPCKVPHMMQGINTIFFFFFFGGGGVAGRDFTPWQREIGPGDSNSA